MQPTTARELLGEPRRAKLLEHIWQRTSLSRTQFALLYGAPLARYASLVQHFPASENHHHSYPGGMLDHGLESVAYALKLRQAHLLPVGAPPETQAAQGEAWTACAAYAALLHDIGKLAVDIKVEYEDGQAWHPWHGPPSRPYRFRYRKDRSYRLHAAAAGLSYREILGTQILDWLHGFPELWSSLLYVLAGHYEHAGVLGELVIQADKASVARDVGGNPEQVRQAPKQSLQRKLLEGLRYLVKERLRLNQPEASDGWLTQDHLWLVSKTVCDKLRAHLLSQGIEGIPESNTAVFNVLQEHAIVHPTAESKAVWKATVTSDAGWSHSFTFLRLSPALIWDAGDRPASFAGTVRVEDGGKPDAADAPATDTLMAAHKNVAPAHSAATPAMHADPPDPVDTAIALPDVAYSATSADIAAPTVIEGMPPEVATPQTPLQDLQGVPEGISEWQESPGGQFMAWLYISVQRRTLKINDAQALVHTVAGTAYLVSPGIFQRYLHEHPDVARAARRESSSDWRWVQKSFERLRAHRKQENGLNIWTCEVSGPRKTRRLHGYLLLDGHAVFADIPFDNPYLKLLPKDASATTAAA